VEGRLAHGAGGELTTGNAAMGYRRLVHGDRVLLGASSFYDHQWPYDERRLGVGAELRSRPLQLNAIYYGTVPPPGTPRRPPPRRRS
jgi:inverse autotransporter-like protein with beta domain